MVSELVASNKRNDLIIRLVHREATAGFTVLVLSGRIEHCEALKARLIASGIDAATLTSRISKANRTRILERFREGSLKVVCATSLADEGLDIARLERLVLATPARAEGRTIQRLGRLMRPYPGKRTPILYDFVDSAPLAQQQFSARMRAYRKTLGAEALRSTVCIGDDTACAGNDEALSTSQDRKAV